MRAAVRPYPGDPALDELRAVHAAVGRVLGREHSLSVAISRAMMTQRREDFSKAWALLRDLPALYHKRIIAEARRIVSA